MELPLEMKKDIELKINRIIEETTRKNSKDFRITTRIIEKRMPCENSEFS